MTTHPEPGVCRCGRRHQPRDHAVPCRVCRTGTFDFHLECPVHETDQTALYLPVGPVVDGIDSRGRTACCGAGPDQIDQRTTERLHLAACAAAHLLEAAS